MAKQDDENLNPSELHDLNINIRELIQSLRNPAMSRLGNLNRKASFVEGLPDKDKYRALDTVTKDWFKRAGNLAQNVSKLERQLNQSGGKGIDKISAIYKKMTDDLKDIQNSAKALNTSGTKEFLTARGKRHLSSIDAITGATKESLSGMGRRIGGYVSVNNQREQAVIIDKAHGAALEQNSRMDRAKAKEEERTKDREARLAEKDVVSRQRNQARESRLASIREEQNELWANREANFGLKYPKWSVYTPSALNQLKSHGKKLEAEFLSEKDPGKRQTLLQAQHENLLAQGNARYQISKGRLFNHGGSPVGTGTKEIGSAFATMGIGALAETGPVGAGIVAVGTLAKAAAKAAWALTSIPAALTSFTGGIVRDASAASSVYRQSQLQSLLGGGNTSDYRQWWDLGSKSNIFNPNQKHPMMIGPAQMTKYLNGMALPQNQRNMLAQQMSRMVYNSGRFGGSLAAIPYLKTLATSAPGYNFNTAHAQVQGPLADLYSMAKSRGQDVNDFYQAMGRSVGTINSMKTVAGGNGASLMSLASSMSGSPNASQQQYGVANTMGDLISGEQSLYGGKFSNSAYSAGQLMFLQKRGGIKGLMKNSRYADLLKKYRKVAPALYKASLSNPAAGMMFMNEALHGSKLQYDYAHQSVGMLGLPDWVQDAMMGSLTKKGYTFGERLNSGLKQSLPSGALLNTSVRGNTNIPGSNSNMSAAFQGPIVQEMQEFSGSLTSLVKARIIPQLSGSMSELDKVVYHFTRTMEQYATQMIHILKAS